MPRNEEGEFELVLGNRQLLSVFFVIVVLMGVCFAAGYIFGRNSSVGTGAAGTKKGGERAIVIDPTASESKGSAQRSSLAPGQAVVKGGGAPATPQQVAAAKPPAEKPAPAAPAPAPVAAAAKPPAETPKPAAAPPPKPAAAPAGVVQPEAGQAYLQVAAVRRPDAETLVNELRKKEFSAVVGPGPNETLFRVLVGPIREPAEIAKQRGRLKELGFDPIVKRY